MWVALCLGSGEVGVVCSFLGVRGEFCGATGKTEGGVDGQAGGSINDCTSSSLLSDWVGEGARSIVMILSKKEKSTKSQSTFCWLKSYFFDCKIDWQSQVLVKKSQE